MQMPRVRIKARLFRFVFIREGRALCLQLAVNCTKRAAAHFCEMVISFHQLLNYSHDGRLVIVFTQLKYLVSYSMWWHSCVFYYDPNPRQIQKCSKGSNWAAMPSFQLTGTDEGMFKLNRREWKQEWKDGGAGREVRVGAAFTEVLLLIQARRGTREICILVLRDFGW